MRPVKVDDCHNGAGAVTRDVLRTTTRPSLPPSLPVCHLEGVVGRLPLTTQVIALLKLASLKLGQSASLPQGLGRPKRCPARLPRSAAEVTVGTNPKRNFSTRESGWSHLCLFKALVRVDVQPQD